MIEPDRVGYSQIVAGSHNATYAKDSAVLALALFFADPPPQIFRVDEFKRCPNRS